MPKIEDILEWHFRPSHFKYSAQRILTQSTRDRISGCVSTLENLIEKMPDGGDMPDKQSIEDVYLLFMNNYQAPGFTMSKRNTRLLVWALDYQPTNDEKILLSDKLISAIYLINKSWRHSFIISLWHVLLKNWSDLLSYKANRKLLTNLLKNKCKQYNKTRSSILNISENIDFFLFDNSPQMYAAYLLEKEKSLDKAAVLLNNRHHIITYDYFACVAHEYIGLSENRNLHSKFIKGVYLFLENHNKKRTTLLICAQIINNEVFNNDIDIVKIESVNLIEDPAKQHEWRSNDLSNEEQTKVEQARRKLSVLLNKEFIEIFFKELVKDERREKYWLKFTDEVRDLKVVGNKANKLYLEKIDDISKSVEDRYIETSSIRNTCALIMHAKDFVFVEFTDIGPLLIYKKDTFDNRIDLDKIETVDDLKVWSTRDYACRNSARQGYVDLYIEGRITHQGRWESRVDAWMRRFYYD